MKVKELLNETNWIKEASARDIDNNSIHAASSEACKWCLWGAIIKCYPQESLGIAIKIGKTKNITLTCWNDASERTFKDIEELIKEFDL